jgi:hypothetical protein
LRLFGLAVSCSLLVGTCLEGTVVCIIQFAFDIATAGARSRVLVVICGGAIPLPKHSSQSLDQISMSIVCFFLVDVSSKLKGPTNAV